MARQQPIELFMPPNMLKAKVGGGLGGIDMAAMPEPVRDAPGLQRDIPLEMQQRRQQLGDGGIVDRDCLQVAAGCLDHVR